MLSRRVLQRAIASKVFVNAATTLSRFSTTKPTNTIEKPNSILRQPGQNGSTSSIADFEGELNSQGLSRSDMIIPRKPRILVIDGYNTNGREQLQSSGASLASDLYVRMLNKSSPVGVDTTVIFPCDNPSGFYVNNFPQIYKYDGVAWTGSSLTVFSGDDDVLKMINMARHFFNVGIPQFGSCFGLQLAAFVSGGHVNKSPKGREMGFGRKIALSPSGLGHPLFQGKPAVFDAFVSHEDEVTHLPMSAIRLCGNPHSEIQAAAVKYSHGEFWAVQYHPEYDLKEMAMLTKARTKKLTNMGFFETEADVLPYVDDLIKIHESNTTKSLKWKYGVDESIISDEVRLIEPRNWILHQVLPYQQQRLTREAVERREKR